MLFQTYQEWINSFPDLSWLDEYFPKMIDSEAIKNNVLSVIQKLNDIEIGKDCVFFMLYQFFVRV